MLVNGLEEIGTLHTIAQVAITLIGFSGIVLVFGERAASKWNPEESIRLFALVAPSLTAFFCSFVPIMIFSLTTDVSFVWKISNAILGFAHLANIAFFIANPVKAELTIGQRINAVIGVLVIISHFLVVFGVIPWAAFVFIFGLLQQIYISTYNFILLFTDRNS
jgi:hypothetical protein